MYSGNALAAEVPEGAVGEGRVETAPGAVRQSLVESAGGLLGELLGRSRGIGNVETLGSVGTVVTRLQPECLSGGWARDARRQRPAQCGRLGSRAQAVFWASSLAAAVA